MRVAAFLDNGDTAFVEHAFDEQGPWITDGQFNAGLYPRWADTTKAADAWRFEQFNITTATEDTLYLRLRMRTNATRNSDGVYVDDIRIEERTSVQESEQSIIGIHPLPASTSVVVGLSSGTAVTSVSAIGMDGRRFDLPWRFEGRTIVVDVRALAFGAYTLHMQQGSVVHTAPIVIYR
jgi:hypothetical protein